MYLQGVDSVYDLEWTDGLTYGDVHHRGEVECSTYNFEEADVDMLFDLFDKYEAEARRLVEKGLVLPAYDYCLKCSHTFNLLDARGRHQRDRARPLHRPGAGPGPPVASGLRGAARGDGPSRCWAASMRQARRARA